MTRSTLHTMTDFLAGLVLMPTFTLLCVLCWLGDLVGIPENQTEGTPSSQERTS